MARVVKKFPAIPEEKPYHENRHAERRVPNLHSRGYVYMWDQWTDGKIWHIQYPEDYTVSDYVMAQIIRTRGNKYGVPVQIQVLTDRIYFKYDLTNYKEQRHVEW